MQRYIRTNLIQQNATYTRQQNQIHRKRGTRKITTNKKYTRWGEGGNESKKKKKCKINSLLRSRKKNVDK